MEAGILTQVLDEFLDVLILSYERILPHAYYFLRWFIVLQAVLLGLMWALGKGEILYTVIRKILLIGFIIWVLDPTMGIGVLNLSEIILNSFSYIGNETGGIPRETATIFNPSLIIDLGLEATRPIFEDRGGIFAIIGSPIDSIVLGWCGIFVLIAYFFIAANIFITVLEFYFFTICGSLFLPFALFKPLNYLSERAIGGAIAIGIKILVLTVVMSISYTVLDTMEIPTDPEWADMFILLFVVGSIAFLCWHAPSMAMSLYSGSPNLTASHAVGMAAGAAYLGTKGAGAAGAAAKGAAKGAVGAYKRATGLLSKKGG